jgi:hypothetical protein
MKHTKKALVMSFDVSWAIVVILPSSFVRHRASGDAASWSWVFTLHGVPGEVGGRASGAELIE